MIVPSKSAARGMTILELMFVVAIMGVVVAGITKVMIDLDKTSRARELNVKLQGEGREGLQVVERDLRHASLGATAGVIWTQDAAGTVVRRPSIQIFDNVSADGAGLNVKRGTDALLVVGARFSGAEAAARGTHYNSTVTLSVTQTTGFAVGAGVLMGPYQQAAWARIAAVIPAVPPTPGGLNLTPTANVYPMGKLEAGSLVREARSRLYYVSQDDELVQADLRVPRAPADGDVTGRNVIATGVENLQIGCELDDGVALVACPAPNAADVTTTEAAWAFGAWEAGAGARLGEVSIAQVRTVVLSVVMRSQSPLADQRGDDAIAVGNQTALSPMKGGSSDATQPYLRRSYRLPVAVRNVSLGAF